MSPSVSSSVTVIHWPRLTVKKWRLLKLILFFFFFGLSSCFLPLSLLAISSSSDSSQILIELSNQQTHFERHESSLFDIMWYLGELLVGPARALFMDEISNGLDSSTTFGIVNSIRQRIHILEGTALISLLQPAPETYELFDDIILLSDGKIVYQGPRENVLEFFERLGFECPKRKAVADFLQEVCFHLPQLWKPCWNQIRVSKLYSISYSFWKFPY